MPATDANPPAPPAGQAVEIPPLKLCPVCRYSLEGLPRAHRCPECGLAYDEFSFASYPRSLWWYAWPALILMAPQWVNMFNLLRFGRWWGIALLSILIVGIAFLVVAYRRRPFVAATPGGLMIRCWLRVRTYSWDSVLRTVRTTIRPRQLSVTFRDQRGIALGHLIRLPDYDPLEAAIRHYREQSERFSCTEPGA